MKYYYVYILKCNDNSYYTGVTNNIERRFEEHQIGEDIKSYTYNKRPVSLVFCEYFLDINQAIMFEKQVKGWTRKKKEAIIADNWEKLKELSVCRNASHFENKGFDSAQPDSPD
ncbi:GIY-YIG nuclease family protein [Pedobacter cryophilus]|uniref:GIY-YIG nuclease family protein n=1 Tax=Pedobacter cryophilus TaxID=2571271 RepID=A0A4U1C0X9_9SPHI|nr:GIY-YIG nuclease family protein [Pedobacter cryophilus]TKB98604.1 GIY-YIG nuclease family protein [Pedobacter cryophilus]